MNKSKKYDMLDVPDNVYNQGVQASHDWIKENNNKGDKNGRN